MTTSASALPALPPNETGRPIIERLNALIRWFNRPDLFVPSYAADTGTGAAYVTTPSADIKVYEIGQEFDFKASHANTVTNPTLNVQGLGAGTITKLGGAALVIGDIAINSFNKVIVASTAPTFELISPVVPATPFVGTGATVFLGADVSLNNAANFFSGPNTGSIGANGQTWLIMGVATVVDSGGASNIEVAIFDGTNYVANSRCTTPGANFQAVVSVNAVVSLTAATTFTLRAKDGNITGNMQTTGAATGVSNKATSITAVRIA